MLDRLRYVCVLLAILGWSCVQTTGRAPRTQPSLHGQSAPEAATTSVPDAADYPPYDGEAFRRLTQGLARKATTRRLAVAPDDPEVLRELLTQQRSDEALVVLRTIVNAHPERMPAAFEAMSGQAGGFESEAHGHRQALQEIVNTAKQQLPRLSREDAARVARQLLLIDMQPTCPGERRIENSLRCFLDDYAGTETAVLTQVDAITFQALPLGDRLAALDRLVREHPGTVVAAKALSQKAFQLSSGNVYSGRPPLEARDADPTPRLLELLDIVNELESGRYPPCEWIRRARMYAVGFFTDQARFAPANIDRLVDAYVRFVVTHFELDPMVPGRYGIGGIVATVIPRLLERNGGNRDIEPLLDRLEREVSDRAAARYLRAAIYIEWLRDERLAIDRSAVYQNAVAALRTLHAAGTGPVNGRALATLASLYFSEREYALARDTFSQYLAHYPRTTWAWLAALRLGQSHEALGDYDAAAQAYSAAATTYAAVPFARALGHAYAAEMWQRLDRFDRALAEQRAALAGWDPDYGLTYTLAEFHPRTPDGWGALVRSVVREDVADDAERLQRSLQRRGGSLLERGRWLVLQGAFREALEPLRNVLAGRGSPEIASAARDWNRRARVGIALQFAAADNPARNVDEARKELATAATGTYEFGVFMADVARASILWQNGSSQDAESAMRAATDRWALSQRELRDRPRTDLPRDVAAIRELILRPPANTALDGFARSALGSQRKGPFLVVDPDVRVRFADQTIGRITVYQSFPGSEHVLFLTNEQRSALSGIVTALDGRQYQARVAAGGAMPGTSNGGRPAVRPFWDRFFPETMWRQTPGEAAPAIAELEFINAERTRAAARIWADNHGATVMLEKVDGRWRVVQLADFSIS